MYVTIALYIIGSEPQVHWFWLQVTLYKIHTGVPPNHCQCCIVKFCAINKPETRILWEWIAVHEYFQINTDKLHMLLYRMTTLEIHDV